MSDYFWNCRARNYVRAKCACTGTGKEASHDLFAELFEAKGLECVARLDRTSFPNVTSIRGVA